MKEDKVDPVFLNQYKKAHRNVVFKKTHLIFLALTRALYAIANFDYYQWLQIVPSLSNSPIFSQTFFLNLSMCREEPPSCAVHLVILKCIHVYTVVQEQIMLHSWERPAANERKAASCRRRQKRQPQYWHIG